MSDDSWKEYYKRCSVCEKDLPPLIFERACDMKEQLFCSTECVRKEIIQRHGCCAKAVPSNCVCAYSFRCPDHGVTHNGTHD
jgi:hypothetical protein